MKQARTILVVCDKFKGSLEADGACEALARGFRRANPEAVVLTRPLADGGEGFVSSLHRALGGRPVDVDVHDALGRPVTAAYRMMESAGGSLAVMEMSAASGLHRIAPQERDPLGSTTVGTGEMMRHAVLVGGADRIIIGIGGSATNDGGVGMAAALGMRFLDAAGKSLHPSPAVLADRLAAVDASAMMALPPVVAACDVDSPLLGPSGATRVFGPQKGVEDWMIPRLETFLERLVRVAGGDAEARTPGSGAAGGLGFGLLRFANARLVPGFELLADLTGLEAEIAAADLVVTGEGSLDFQTLAGKGPAGVAALARKHAKPVMAFCGAADTAVRESGLFDSITALADSGRAHEVLMTRAAEFLEEAAAGAVQIGSGVNGNQ